MCAPATYDDEGDVITTCGCVRTATLSLEFFLRERQPLLFGTTQWFASYSRRSAIEHVHSEARAHRDMNFDRFCSRVHGASRNHALITFGLVGLNVRKIRDWHLLRLAPNPWLAAIGDHSDAPPTDKLKRRKRHPRARALHECVERPHYLTARNSRKTFADVGRRPVPLVRTTAVPHQPG
ncbi:hypothetical protein FA014_03770 [Cellulomonas hominis]|uniref:Transposase DDE domain-containing protein n=1 Tax=Cellulomonas hominis TaxID=156981 RepID=A0A7Z8NRM8_9CELL|nr:hypothetical protein [Cellulomonas hominis]TKR26774.1 hypothetical protein FA014_03770 [Cellulomonas hominis]